MINIDTFVRNGNYRLAARVKWYYDIAPRYTWANVREWSANNYAKGKLLRGAPKDIDSQIMAMMSSPSTNVYIDRLPKIAQENFWCLVDWAATEEATTYTELEGVGFIVPHRNKKLGEHIFVVHGGHANPRHRDTEREAVYIVRLRQADIDNLIKYERRRWEVAQDVTAGPWGVTPGHTLEQHLEESKDRYIKGHGYQGRLNYVDCLTKKDRDKLAVLKLMPDNKFLEGFGGVTTSNYKDARVFILQGD